MSPEHYIAALIRRGDLGASRDLALAIAELVSYQPGIVVEVSAAQLAPCLGRGRRTVEDMRTTAIACGLIARVGRSGLSLNSPASWQAPPTPKENSPLLRSEPVGTMRSEHVEHLRSVTVERIRSAPVSYVESVYFPDLRSEPVSYAEAEPVSYGLRQGSPQTPLLKASKDLKDKQPPRTAASTATPSSTDCLLELDSNANDKKKAFATARHFVNYWALPTSDANGIGAVVLELARRHPSHDVARGLDSAVSLLEQLAGDGSFHSGAEVVGALRNRWGQWVEGGGELPRAEDVLASKGHELPPATTTDILATPKPGGKGDGPIAKEAKVMIDKLRRDAQREATTTGETGQGVSDKRICNVCGGPFWVATAEAPGETCIDCRVKEQGATSPDAAKGPRARRSGVLEGAEATLAASMAEYARAHPCSEPTKQHAQKNGKLVVAVWRRLDGRESVQLVGGKRIPQRPRQLRWALALWPDLQEGDWTREADAPAVTLTTKEPV